MFYANDKYGQKTYIGDAEPKQSYFCPACGAEMRQRRGEINAHHFYHKVGKECDPWYTGKMSAWHAEMQNHFKKSMQEVVIWNSTHTEHHVADVLIPGRDKKYVIEFQHSSISRREFLSRSQFYIDCGHKIFWVFDFCECTPKKRILIADTGYEQNRIRLVWPGNDRVRFLDNIDLSGFDNNLYIAFHIKTAEGILISQTINEYISREKWEYKNAFLIHPCFVVLHPDYFYKADDFLARYYSEQDFFNMLKRLGS